MAEYTVLYHDPVRLSSDQAATYLAGQSVWVCRDDRYAFEVQVFALRADPSWDFTAVSCGEARYRLALARAGGVAAWHAACESPLRRDVVVVECTSEEVARFALDLVGSRTTNFGDVIDRFTVATADEQSLQRAG